MMIELRTVVLQKSTRHAVQLLLNTFTGLQYWRNRMNKELYLSFEVTKMNNISIYETLPVEIVSCTQRTSI